MNLNKFRISGFPRTGTTLLAAILNSQKNSCCLDMSIEAYNDNEPKTMNRLCIMLETIFTNNGIIHPDFRQDNISKTKTIFYNFVSDYYQVLNIGTKSTKGSLKNLTESAKKDIKIIIMRRKTESILSSWYNKFDVTLLEIFETYIDYLKKMNFFNIDSEYKKNFYIMEFENLVNNTENELNKLSQFLNYEIEVPTKLYYSLLRNKIEWKNNSSFGDLTDLIDRRAAKREVEDNIKKLARYIDSPNLLNFPFNLLGFKYLVRKLKKYFR